MALRSTAPETAADAYDEDADLPLVWQERFAHFDAYGSPNTSAGRHSFKQVGLGQRIRLGGNFKAFFFGIIYLLVLGLWKRAIVLSVISSALYIAFNAAGMPSVANAVGFGIMGFNMWTTNGAFYRKRRTGVDTWNIFN